MNVSVSSFFLHGFIRGFFYLKTLFFTFSETIFIDPVLHHVGYEMNATPR